MGATASTTSVMVSVTLNPSSLATSSSGGPALQSPRVTDNKSGRDCDLEQQGAYYAADDRADDRDPAVAPIRATLAGYGQDSVRYARPEVAGRVDTVAARYA